MKIAVTTPTGKVGRRVVRKLLEEGKHDILLLARSADKLREEADKGAKIREGDLADADFVVEATKGVDALFWVIPPNIRAANIREFYSELAQNAVRAIKSNKIGHTVLLSSVGAHLGEGVGVVNGLHDAESILEKATDNLTILRPVYFMDNYLMSLDSIAEDNRILLPVSGQARIPMIATEDIAEAAVERLTDSPPDKTEIVPLHGPKEYTFDEAARILSSATGRELKHVKITSQDMKSALTGMGASENVADQMTELYDAIESGRLKTDAPRTDQTTTSTSFEQFSTDVLAPILNK